MGKAHPPADISLDGLAVTTHRSVPSSPLAVKVVGMERHHLSWQRGAWRSSNIKGEPNSDQ
jgi:hypothetical protein